MFFTTLYMPPGGMDICSLIIVLIAFSNTYASININQWFIWAEQGVKREMEEGWMVISKYWAKLNTASSSIAFSCAALTKAWAMIDSPYGYNFDFDFGCAYDTELELAQRPGRTRIW
jgi:hypothetical protein